jgi:hypothetical protein
MVMSPAGLATKDDCAGEGQQQFTLPTEGNKNLSVLKLTHYLNVEILLQRLSKTS